MDNPRYRSKISSARKIIYEKNRTVNSKFVNDILKSQSLVPTEVCSLLFSFDAIKITLISQNAFSERLSRFGFNFFSIFLVDFMHEFELGVWKKVFVHLLRMLECVPGAINKLDQRQASHSIVYPYLMRDQSQDFATCRLSVEIQSVDLQTMSLN